LRKCPVRRSRISHPNKRHWYATNPETNAPATYNPSHLGLSDSIAVQPEAICQARYATIPTSTVTRTTPYTVDDNGRDGMFSWGSVQTLLLKRRLT